MPTSKKDKARKELEKIKQMNAVLNILNKSDLEDQLLYSESDDSSVHADESQIDSRINQLSNSMDNSNKEMKLVESISVEKAGSKSIRKKKTIEVKGKGKNAKVRRKVHISKGR